MNRSVTLWCALYLLASVAIALGFPLAVRAQSLDQPLDELDEAHPRVRAFARSMADLQSFSADIECAIETPSLTTEKGVKGRILARGESYKIVTPGLELYSDGRSRWQYLSEQNEVTIVPLDSVEAAPLDHPLQLFKRYATYFKVRYRGERRESGKTYLDYSFYPRNLRQPYSQIHLEVLGEGYIPSKLTYRGKDGTTYLIVMRNFKKNAPIAESLGFDSAHHPGVTVVDLR